MMKYEGSEDDHALLERLIDAMWRGEDEAWTYVYLQVVLPVLRFRTRRLGVSYYRIMIDRGLNERTILAMLYHEMIGRQKLSLYGFRGSFVKWLRTYAIKEILIFCKKNPHPVSDEDAPEVIFDDRKRVVDEQKEVAQACFAALWRQNPKRAYVLLLKTRENMASEAIMKMLGMSSANNVDKVFSRAVEDMRVLRQKSEEEKL